MRVSTAISNREMSTVDLEW